MKTIEQLHKVDTEVMRALRLSEIRHVIAYTSKGDLTFVLPWAGTKDDYTFYLDSVPVDDESNQKLILLYKGVIFE